MAPDGAILAMVGGRSYPESQFNRAIQAKRQAGVAVQALRLSRRPAGRGRPGEHGGRRPTQIGEWEPENYGGRYRGRVTLKTAFANSINTVAVQLADAVGIDKVIEAARGLGVQSELPEGAEPGARLGRGDADRDGQGLWERRGRNRDLGALRLRTVTAPASRSIPARRRRPGPWSRRSARPDRDAARRGARGDGQERAPAGTVSGGKTGTTQESRDAWFVGFTPAVTIGVWVGNDDNAPTKNVTGGDLPAKIWRAVAADASAAQPRETGSLRPREAALGPRGQPPAAAAPPAAPIAPPVRGVAAVRDTGTIEVDGQEIRLAGLEGMGGRAARDLTRYLRRRPVLCEAEAAVPRPTAAMWTARTCRA
jgi:membrane peptidoglycan carboxypeptidase